MIVARTLRRAVAAGAATVAVAGLAVVGTPGAGAQEEFILGSGKADAKVLRMGPSAGRLSLAPTIGLSLADYLGTSARGEARTADYAALDGSIPPEMKERLPTVRAESTEEDAGTPRTATFAGTPPESPIQVGAAQLSATAQRDPKGASSFELGAYGVPGVFEIAGSSAASHAAIIGNRTREAVGTSRISSIKLGGGAVTLNGVTWEAVQRTGEGATQKAEFRVDSVSMLQSGGTGPLGIPLPPVPVTVPGGDLGALLGQINAALKPTGLVVATPSTSTESGISRVGPLTVSIADSEIGRTALGPILGQLQPIRDPLTGALINANSEFSTAVLLADVAVGIFSGAGRNDIEFGGASAFTEGERFESPFGDFNFGSFTLPDAGDDSFSLGASDTDTSFGTSPSFSADGSTLGASGPSLSTGGGATGAVAGSTGGTNRETAVPLAASRTIEGRRGGIAALIGLLGLLAALGVAGMDYRQIRSNRRTIVVS